MNGGSECLVNVANRPRAGSRLSNPVALAMPVLGPLVTSSAVRLALDTGSLPLTVRQLQAGGSPGLGNHFVAGALAAAEVLATEPAQPVRIRAEWARGGTGCGQQHRRLPKAPPDAGDR
jgi:hypothetical protein